jgi:hypothetical protein
LNNRLRFNVLHQPDEDINNSYYYDYNGCGYNPGAAVVGGLIGGALNGLGVY